MMKKILSVSLSLLFFSFSVFAQTPCQVVKGRVLDKSSQSPLVGALIFLKGDHTSYSTISETDGVFRLSKIPVGRYNVQCSFLGYDSAIITELLVVSGKECVLTIEMIESARTMSEVVVHAHSDKDKPLNNMAAVSARSFNVEEAHRYAGGLDDPARLVSSFAGVSMGGSVQDNAIVIRGNAPKGVLWRIEGVDVPNPSHFSGGNVAGGGFVTMISSQVLANSDFFTGAFPAEYGNALAGVFDVKLRTGNQDKREYTVKAGVMGIDLAAEGPFIKGKKASYLFNYRYSTFGLLTKLGAIPTDQIPIYQDLSFKINLPTRKLGVFSVWGIGGLDQMCDPEDRDSANWVTSRDRYTNEWDERVGVLGVNHRSVLNPGSFLSTSIVASGNARLLSQERLDDQFVLQNDMYLKSNTGKLTFSTYVNSKLNARISLKSGLNVHELYYNLNLNGTVNDEPGTYGNFVNEKGHSSHIQMYTESELHLADAFSIHSGLQIEYFDLSKRTTIDPRIAITWNVRDNQSLSLGYGKHSQLEELSIYFIRKGTDVSGSQSNSNLDFSHAHHLVLAYNWRINDLYRIKIESYFQYLYKVPGISDSSFSMINYKQDLTFRSLLTNNSKGQNAGIDLTIERFLQNQFYYLFTASVFDSKYQGGDRIWRHSRYDKDFVLNVLIGKEFYLGSYNRNILGVNGKLYIAGGERYTPLLEAESNKARRAIYDESKAFEAKDKASAFLSLSCYYRVNHKNYSSMWSFQMNNALRTAQYDKYEYHYKSKTMEREKVVYATPSISYKLEF